MPVPGSRNHARVGLCALLLLPVLTGLNAGRARASSTDPLFPEPTFYVGGNPISVAVGDFNGDGKPDLAIANDFGNTVSVLLGNGNGTFASKTGYGTGDGPVSLAIGDFNGDGKPDLAVANEGSATVSVLLGPDQARFFA